MGSALVLDEATKRYGEVLAVDRLSLAARPGEILGFLGPNGAGKTTSLRMALGLVVPTSGRIEILGATSAAKVRDRIGFLPEERGLYRRMTPLQVIVFFAGLRGLASGEARQRGRRLLEEQGLGEVMDRQIRTLSKGMAQKVQLLSAVAHEPDLVILDEPFSGLDPVNQQSLETLIRGIAARGATVIFSTHVMQHAERLCDHVVLIAGGRKVFDGPVDEARAAAPRVLIAEGALEAGEIAGLKGVASVVEEAAPEGRRIRAELAPDAAAHDVMRQAFARGLDVSRLEIREPSLHEAFIVLTGGGAE
jgi:ABC-2 type transport system ATP-binding protein